MGGLGYQFENGLGLSAGYDYGLTSLDAGNRFHAQNRVIKVGLNYSFLRLIISHSIHSILLSLIIVV